MQEEVENKAVTLAINTTKMTARALKNAISKYLNHLKQKSRDSPVPTGKQSVKKLIGQGQGVSNIEITDNNIKSFEKIARKYGVDYALKKDTNGKIPKYLVFFKAKDADALTSAFKEFTAKSIKREKKPSILSKLRKLKALLNSAPKREKKKELER
jgi:hypothetical protein